MQHNVEAGSGLTASRISPAERLKDLRKSAGYKNASQAARKFGWVVGTYLSHENGNRGIGPETARRYADALRVDPNDILYGAGLKSKAVKPSKVSLCLLDEPLLAKLIEEEFVFQARAQAEAIARKIFLRASRSGSASSANT